MVEGQTADALQRELAAVRAERDEAYAREAALVEVLRAVNASPGEPGPVFTLITERAMTMCDADGADLLAIKDGFATALALSNPTPAQVAFWKTPFDLRRGAMILESRPKTRHIVDLADTEIYRQRLPLPVMGVEGGGMRTLVHVPLVGEHGLIGQFALFRRSVRPFTDRQIALVEAFAAQAALAIENARLLTEQREALDQQTATAEVLRVISQSPTDVQPALDAIVSAARRFCGAGDASVTLRDGSDIVLSAHDGAVPGEGVGARLPLDRTTGRGRSILDATTVHLPDTHALDGAEYAAARQLAIKLGFRALLSTPMLHQGDAIGCLTLRRPEPGPFTQRQIELLETFAAQAVIAIQNVRLFTELRDSLDQQTATAGILRAISQSPTDVAPVLDAVVKAAVRFCGATDAVIGLLRDRESFEFVVQEGPIKFVIGRREPLNRETAIGRAILDSAIAHLVDIPNLDPVEFADARKLARDFGVRTALAAPMISDGAAIGAIGFRKPDPTPFTPRQIDLVQTFAAQAVIAIQNVRLFTELQSKNAALTAALEQQTATAEILQVISQSPTDVQPVFDAIVRSAVRLCEGLQCALYSYDGTLQHLVAQHGVEQEILAALRANYPRPPDPGSVTGTALLEGTAIHLTDLRADPRFADPASTTIRAGYRAVLAMPMLKDGGPIGVIFVVRREARAFSDTQVELLQTFAAQAVIAIENVRLFTELRESLDQQTATAEILRVISQSPTDIAPVLDAVAKAAVRFCGAEDVAIALRDGDSWHGAAHVGPIPSSALGNHFRLARDTLMGCAILDGQTMHAPDLQALDPVEFAGAREMGDRLGLRSALIAPLMRDGLAIGAINLRRRTPGSFAPRQIALLEAFAAQAVIAIENVRLFTELRESLEQQTASAGVLRVISQSPTSVQPVFDAIAESALRLLNGWGVIVWRYEGGRLQFGAAKGGHPGSDAALPGMLGNLTPDDIFVGDALRHGAFKQIVDVESEPVAPALRELARVRGWRSNLAVPMIREGHPVGVLTLARVDPGAFTEREIRLLQSFADQAVIAIENVRLFTELHESLERQTATTEILQAINGSPGELQPVFEAILEKAMTLCDAGFGTFATFDGQRLNTVATRGVPEAFARYRLSNPPVYGPGTGPARLIAGEDLVHDADAADSEPYRRGDPSRRALVELGGARTILNVALRKDRTLLGTISIYRQEVRPFSDNQIALLQAFAAQAVIAMENARLLGELRQRTDDLQESLEYQTATSEVLEVISRSTSDLTPVLDTMLAAAARLCGVQKGDIAIRQGEAFRCVTSLGAGPEELAWLNQRVLTPGRTMTPARALMERQVVQVLDQSLNREHLIPDEIKRPQTVLAVPLLREGEPIGVITLVRGKVEAFSERQVALIRTFADQAVIAMENARLLGELRESLDQQTATSDVLKTISRSSVSLETVLDTLVETVARLCRADQAYMYRRRGELHHLGASHGLSAEALEFMRTHPFAPDEGTTSGRVVVRRQTIHIHDVLQDAAYTYSEGQKVAGFRTMLGIPLMAQDKIIGVFVVSRTRVEPFGDKEIALATGFADQAVIAIENARLFEELRESLDQQTATSDVLRTISGSSVNLESVLDTLVETVARLCRGDQSYLFRQRGQLYYPVASHGASAEAIEFLQTHPFEPDEGTTSGRVVLHRKTVHIHDVLQDEGYSYGDGPKVVGYRTMLGIPLMVQDKIIGVFVVARARVEPFSDKEIALATGFADQAVIAIENARLFEELRDREAELRVTFDNMGDGVAMFDDGQRLAAWNRNFQEMLDVSDSFLATRPLLDDYVRLLVERGEFGQTDPATEIARLRGQFNTQWSTERTRPDGRVIEVRNNPVPGGGAVLIYGDVTERKKAEAEIRAARDAAEAALDKLTAAQANLVQSEKMASLGQLTAGIAHEIKNPLNFVNNFAVLSIELLDELKEVAGPALATLDQDRRAETDETMGLLTANLDKIAEHGKRADGIVRSMLSHSRGGSGDWQAADINALVEEALNLAYHGARAQDKDFNVTLERDFDTAGKPIEVVPQDVTRVFLNLFGNGFYATSKRRLGGKEAGFRPVLKVSTRDLGDAVEVRVRDNGIGIPTELRDKLFQPFFTTKPTGEGTGLGLSISYDIVTQQHGGTIAVESEPGAFTEFTVRLPRGRRVAKAERA